MISSWLVAFCVAAAARLSQPRPVSQLSSDLRQLRNVIDLEEDEFGMDSVTSSLPSLDSVTSSLPSASSIPGASALSGVADKVKAAVPAGIPGADTVSAMTSSIPGAGALSSLTGGDRGTQGAHVDQGVDNVQFCDIKVTCWQGGNDDDGDDADPRKLQMVYHPDKAGGKPLEMMRVHMSVYDPIPQYKMVSAINECTDVYKKSLLAGGCGLSKEEQEQVKSLSQDNNDIFKVGLYAQGESVKGQLKSKDGIGTEVRWNQKLMSYDPFAEASNVLSEDLAPVCNFELMIKMDVKNDWKPPESYKPKILRTDYQSGVTVEVTERYEVVGKGMCTPELTAIHIDSITKEKCEAQCETKETCIGYEYSPPNEYSPAGWCKVRKKGLGQSAIIGSTRDGTATCFRKKVAY